MARKTKEEALKTKISILDSALSLIYERGYSKTSLVDIAKQLGLTKGAVYWHFESKKDLFITLIKDISEKMDKILDPIARKIKTPNDLKSFFHEYALVVAQDQQINKFFNILVYKIEWNEDLSDATELLNQNDDEIILYIEYLFKKWKKKKIISKDIEPLKTAKVLISHFYGVVYDSATESDLIELVDISMDIFFKGIEK
ncbi:MAG: TetR family transcriptional regulator [Deltaproteobacteria bacterium]|nr:TetR family transcriptional regulator [Deltaproteobacteria bacterium]